MGAAAQALCTRHVFLLPLAFLVASARAPSPLFVTVLRTEPDANVRLLFERYGSVSNGLCNCLPNLSSVHAATCRANSLADASGRGHFQTFLALSNDFAHTLTCRLGNCAQSCPAAWAASL